MTLHQFGKAYNKLQTTRDHPPTLQEIPDWQTT